MGIRRTGLSKSLPEFIGSEMLIRGENGVHDRIALRRVAQPLALNKLLQALLNGGIHGLKLAKSYPAGELEISTLAFFLLGLK